MENWLKNEDADTDWRKGVLVREGSLSVCGLVLRAGKVPLGALYVDRPFNRLRTPRHLKEIVQQQVHNLGLYDLNKTWA